MKRVLVTGANGFIGRHSIEPLLRGGYEVHCIGSRLPGHLPQGTAWTKANLLDKSEVSEVMERIRPSHLLHFAWYVEPGKFWDSLENYPWVEASLFLLRKFESCGGKRAVFAGTCVEYDWTYGFCSEATTPRTPPSPYGICKSALYSLFESYCRKTGLSGAWGRIFFLYGPWENPARLVSSVVCSMLRGEPVRTTHGNQLRDFLHVADVADAFVSLLESEVEGAVNIASGHPTSLKEIVLDAARLIRTDSNIQFGALPVPENDPPLVVGDIRKLTDQVGWRPKFDLHSGLENTVEWWKTKLKE